MHESVLLAHPVTW